MRVRSSRPRALVGVFTRLDGLRKSQGLLGRRHRGGHGPRGTPRPVPRLGYGAPRGAGGLPRQGRRRKAPRRRQGAARLPHAARVRRGDPGRQSPRRARAGGVAAQADARERPRRGLRARRPPRRGGGDRAPRAGGPPPPRVRGHRETARHLRQAGLRVADHVITLREFRGTQVRSDPRPSGVDRRVAVGPSRPKAAWRRPRGPVCRERLRGDRRGCPP